MDAEERQEFEANRAELIDNAYIGYGITLKINKSDQVYVSNADLGQMVEFYQNYRSEIEEVI